MKTAVNVSHLLVNPWESSFSSSAVSEMKVWCVCLLPFFQESDPRARYALIKNNMCDMSMGHPNRLP